MTAEQELALVAKTCDSAIKKLINMRQQWLQMGAYVHELYCGCDRVKNWRQCKSQVCRRFLAIVKLDGRGR